MRGRHARQGRARAVSVAHRPRVPTRRRLLHPARDRARRRVPVCCSGTHRARRDARATLAFGALSTRPQLRRRPHGCRGTAASRAIGRASFAEHLRDRGTWKERRPRRALRREAESQRRHASRFSYRTDTITLPSKVINASGSAQSTLTGSPSACQRVEPLAQQIQQRDRRELAEPLAVAGQACSPPPSEPLVLPTRSTPCRPRHRPVRSVPRHR